MMTFFRIDPAATAVVRYPKHDALLVVVEYAQLFTRMRLGLLRSEGVWKPTRGAIPTGPLFRAMTLPDGLLQWLDGTPISDYGHPVFVLPDAWLDINAHLQRHGALNG
jgi:hypothetical protein